jgi:hypothetical protein
MYWIWTRPFAHYLDPDANLAITASVHFRSFFSSFTFRPCGAAVPSPSGGCFERKMNFNGLQRDVQTYDDAVEELSGARPSMFTWKTNSKVDTVFDSFRVREQDLEFPQLELRVCDPEAERIRPDLIHKHLAKFPLNAPLQVITRGVPKDMQQVSGGFKNLPIVLVYDFKPEPPRQQGQGCILIPYSY